MEPWTQKASRSLIATITTGAALATILVHTRTLGLMRDTRELVAGSAARRVTVQPVADTATAIGDTIVLAATVIDRHGGVLPGASVTWRSDNPSVATVDGSGMVIAWRPGTTFISASVGDALPGRARVAVVPEVVELRVVADTPFHVPEGETRTVLALALDARGRPFPNGTPVWQSADTAIALVDEAGNVSGVMLGRTTLSATLDGHWGHLEVDVVPKPAAIVLHGGADQHAPVGRALPEPIEVQVFSRSGRPAAGVPVSFAPVVSGLGSVESASYSTDAEGRARARWVMGAVPGRQRLVVSAPGLDSTLTVTAEADPVDANTFVSLAHDPPEGRAGETLGAPIAIRVVDSLGKAVHDVPVTWNALDGGAVVVLASRTDSLGEVFARWTLGPETGAQRLRVQVGDARSVPALVVEGHAGAGPPATAAIASGDGQRGRVGAALARPVVLRVLDSLANPVPGVVVTVEPAAGSVVDSAPVSDSLGRVAIHWTLGRQVGTQRLRARVAGIDPALEATARARPLDAANLAFVDPPSSGSAGRAIAKPVSVTVRDAYGNPVSDSRVSFTVKTGSVTPVHVMTDAHGVASTRWTLGKTAGEQSLTARVRATGAHATLTVTADTPPTRKARSPS